MKVAGGDMRWSLNNVSFAEEMKIASVQNAITDIFSEQLIETNPKNMVLQFGYAATDAIEMDSTQFTETQKLCNTCTDTVKRSA